MRNAPHWPTIEHRCVILRHEAVAITMFTWLEHLDHQLFLAVNPGLSTAVLDVVFQGLVPLGNGFVLVLLAGVGLWWRDRPTFTRQYGWLIVAVCAGTLVVQGLKYGIARPRPLREFAPLIHAGALHINVIGDALRSRSFPSGHAQAAASVGVYLLCLYPHRWFWWGAGIALAGFARVYAGAHFPLDVLIGICIGATSAVGVFALQRQRHQPIALQRQDMRR